ncbi:ribosomal protein S18 acetylase RimI-like enzyme [Catenulispora sp. EB89]|uniref:GNAT family N-acetyltransferase n=1 Tax=Catenulispora sp. EB89 TaxID=3156257 RepID=UPI003512B9AA
MNAIAHLIPDPVTPVITRVAADQWHAIEDDLTVGRGNTSRRPDGRLFISIDAWHDTVFDQLAAVMLAELPAPLYTVLDAEDSATAENWRRVGFVERRRERHYLVPLEARITVQPPAGVTFGGGDDVYRAEVDASEVGLVRLIPLMSSDGTPRIARIASIEVHADHRRRGIGRALLAHALDALRERGFRLASADVAEDDTAAIVLAEGAGARRTSNSMELMWQD